MSYKNILNVPMEQYNKLYRLACKEYPSKSISEKKSIVLKTMCKARGIDDILVLYTICAFPFEKEYQYAMEMSALLYDIDYGIDRYYVKDDSLFDFFRSTEVRQKEVQSILDTLDSNPTGTMWGVIGQNYSCLITYTLTPGNDKHIVTVFRDDLNQTFCVEDCNERNDAYNIAMNFLFYINAFPECIIDGVPNGVKRNPKAKSISISDKVVSHTTVEHGFVRPHFRSGYFRHFNSDWYVNCTGQVRFIASTMVKGKAKTVINKEER